MDGSHHVFAEMLLRDLWQVLLTISESSAGMTQSCSGKWITTVPIEPLQYMGIWMTLLQTTIFQGLAVTILSRLKIILFCSFKDYPVRVTKGHHWFRTRHQLYDESEEGRAWCKR